MRKLFWIFLFMNVILFALMQRSWIGWGEQGVQAQPDLNSEMIRLLPPSQSTPAKVLPAPIFMSAPAIIPVPALSAPVSVGVSPAPVQEPSKSPSKLQLALDMAASAVVKPGTLVCLEWGEFSGPDLTRATAALSALQLADKLSQRQIEREIGYWVYIPPLRNKAAVNRKVAELRALGIREYFVVQNSGSWQNAISLGIFKTRDAAQNFLHELQAKGVRTSQVGERVSKLKATIFMLNRVDAATEVKLTLLQKEFAGSEINKVPCALTR
jgi:hypothetical protein